MTNPDRIEELVNLFEEHLEQAILRVSDPPAFLGAMNDIEDFLAKNWSSLQNITGDESQALKSRITEILAKLDLLQRKADARLNWIEQLREGVAKGLDEA